MPNKIFEGLGPGSLVPQRGKLPIDDPRLGMEDGFLLSRVDGHTSLDQLCLLVPFEERATMLMLRRLWEIGAIDVPGVERVAPPRPARPTPPPSPPAPPAERGGLSNEQAARIDEIFSALSLWNAFELLEVELDSDSKEIKRAYYKLSKEFHPDRFFGKPIGDYGRKLNAIFQAVKSAFELLSDDQRRAAYLAQLQSE